MTKNETQVFGETLRNAMKEGAFGLSFGLSYLHERSTTLSELKNLAAIIKQEKGILAIHLREQNKAGIDEAIAVAKDSGAPTLVNHLLPVRGNENDFATVLDAIDALPAELDFHFETRPEKARATALYMLLPAWAQKGNLETMRAEIADEWLQKKIARDIADLDPAQVVVKEAPRNEVFVGKNFEELGEIFGKQDFRATLVEFMKRTELKAVVWERNVDAQVLETALKHPRSLVGSHASGEEIPPSSVFPRLLGNARSNGDAALQEIIEKITGVPAQKFGIKGRGVIKEGYSADLAGFSFPHDGINEERMAEMDFVIVNGVPVVLEGKNIAESRAGRILKKAP